MVEQPAGSKGSNRFETFGKKVDKRFSQSVPRAEEELKKVIAYLNDEVVPQLRQDSSHALRAAAERLRKLAEQLDNNPSPGAQ